MSQHVRVTQVDPSGEVKVVFLQEGESISSAKGGEAELNLGGHHMTASDLMLGPK